MSEFELLDLNGNPVPRKPEPVSDWIAEKVEQIGRALFDDKYKLLDYALGRTSTEEERDEAYAKFKAEP